LSLLLMVNMACTLFRMTVPEALAGVTRYAAQALGLQATHGCIASGCPANFVLWPLNDVAELAYWLGQRPTCTVVRQGRLAVDGMGVQGSAT
jgi:imidazolonepropionase